MGVLAVVTAVHFFSGLDLADRGARSALRPGEATAFDDRTQILAQLALAGSILTALAWFVWLHRAVANARSLGVPTEATPGWSVGWWFIPFANIIKPYRILRSLYDGVGTGGGGIVGAWWGCYLIAGVLGEFAQLQSSPTWAAFRTYTLSFLACDVFRVIAAILAALLVWTIDEGIASLAQNRALPNAAPIASASEATP